jgi:hypothetical protein
MSKIYEDEEIIRQAKHLQKSYPGNEELFVATDMNVFPSMEAAQAHINSGSNSAEVFLHIRNGEMIGRYSKRNAVIREKKKHPREL